MGRPRRGAQAASDQPEDEEIEAPPEGGVAEGAVADNTVAETPEENAEAPATEEAQIPIEEEPAKLVWNAPRSKIFTRMHADMVKAPWENESKDNLKLHKWHARDESTLTRADDGSLHVRELGEEAQEVKDALEGKSGVLECELLQYYGGEKRGQVAEGGISTLTGKIPEIRSGQIAMVTGDEETAGDKFMIGTVDRIFVHFSVADDRELPLTFWVGIYNPDLSYCLMVRVRTRTQFDRSQHSSEVILRMCVHRMLGLSGSSNPTMWHLNCSAASVPLAQEQCSTCWQTSTCARVTTFTRSRSSARLRTRT